MNGGPYFSNFCEGIRCPRGSSSHNTEVMTCNVTCAGEVERRGIFPFGDHGSDQCIFSVIGNNVL